MRWCDHRPQSSTPYKSLKRQRIIRKTEMTAAANPVERGVRNCQREEAAYRSWLGFLGPLRWLCLGGGVVLPAVAGLSALGETAFFGPNWKVVSALLAFAGSALTGLHGALKCDTHQAECRRLIQAVRGIRLEYESSVDLDAPQRASRLAALQAEFAKLVRDASATPAWCYSKTGRPIR